MLEAYRSFGLATEQFDGEDYVRLRRLKRLIEDGRLDPELRWVTS